MADVAKVNVDGANYNIKDSVARERIESVKNDMDNFIKENFYDKEQVEALISNAGGTLADAVDKFVTSSYDPETEELKLDSKLTELFEYEDESIIMGG